MMSRVNHLSQMHFLFSRTQDEVLQRLGQLSVLRLNEFIIVSVKYTSLIKG